MNADPTAAVPDRFIGTAFNALTEISRILREAVVAKQEFTFSIDGKKNDGSCEILIRVQPPAEKP
jgi:hypothetical protein